jgi:hypothetical protein
MKKLSRVFFLFMFFIIVGCNKDSLNDTTDETEKPLFNSSDGVSAESPNTGGGDVDSSGQITAGEWNDLANWNYWNDLNNNQDFAEEINHWRFYFDHRLSVSVKNMSGMPIVDASLNLKTDQGLVVWSAKSDNKGNAELWIKPFEKTADLSPENYSLWVNGKKNNITLREFEQGVNEVQIKNTKVAPKNVEIAFIVDATGSMSDELEFLKDDLKNIIQKVESSNSNLEILTSSVFYRDVQDEYVVKHSPFTANINNTLAFINNQSASGGGDFPEAVHTALNTALQDLQWSSQARTRLAFLILDAPPHHDQEVISELQNSVKQAAQKGIKLIPVTASGIDKETEFLMRHFSISTNSTYVFLTNHSGIGNDHLEPSIGEYEVELLNELLIRLIKKYSE